MEGPLAVLLRDGTHAGASTRLMLKVEQLSIQIGKTPIQVPVARSTPILLDLGMTRPTITISGVVDNIGTDLTNTTNSGDDAYSYNMESESISGQTYYVPYKNFLENKLITWVTGAGVTLQLEIGDATTPDFAGSGTTASTGGGIYEVAVQQAQFSMQPGQEDRWVYSIGFAGKLRNGITF